MQIQVKITLTVVRTYVCRHNQNLSVYIRLEVSDVKKMFAVPVIFFHVWMFVDSANKLKKYIRKSISPEYICLQSS